MSKAGLDSSALLALLYAEDGADQVSAALRDGAVMSALNLAEVVVRIIR